MDIYNLKYLLQITIINIYIELIIGLPKSTGQKIHLLHLTTLSPLSVANVTQLPPVVW